MRGNDGMDIFRDDIDRIEFLRRLAATVVRNAWRCESWCLMGNHVHLLVETEPPMLGRGAQSLFGGYALRFNLRHGRRNHLFGDRYWAELIETEDRLLTCARYMALNPVKDDFAELPEEWDWSSFAATVGLAPAPTFLQPEMILGTFGSGATARGRFNAFVLDGIAELGGP
jgi:REP element-mobilizing transposase RayT